jgi:hypothetical protein
MYYVPKTYRFHPYCFNCYCVLHPEAQIPHRYRLKEQHMIDHLSERFPDCEMVFNRAVDDGCSARRPDVRIECGTHTVIAECDENQHRGYSCETKRMMELFEDCGARPIVFLRLNPDAYTRDGVTYPSCFTPTAMGLALDQTEWSRRMDKLVERVAHHTEVVPTKEVVVEELFFS